MAMVMKSVAIGTALMLALSTPVTLPVMQGKALTLAIGPVALSYQRDDGVDFGLEGRCLTDQCPFFVLRVEEPSSIVEQTVRQLPRLSARQLKRAG
jgi:hypothetical protein